MRSKSKKLKPSRWKTQLGLPDQDHAKAAVLASLHSPESQRSYRHAIEPTGRIHSGGRRFVVGFQGKSDAKRFQAELTERMRKFNLELHPEKTCLLEFGPFAIRDRQRRGEGKPETFNFLGFTHICGKKRSSGRFTVLRRRMHHPIPEVGQWLRSVVDGHNRYYGVPMNDAALHLFRLQVGRLWHRALSRRSQNGHVPWDRMHRLIAHWLHPVRIYHPYPLRRMGVVT
jgi:RNA-directed DNA polymerase